MATYSTFKYFKKLYGDFAPFRSSSLLFAQVIDYNLVRLSVEAPERVGTNYVIVRTNNGAAQDPSNGKTVASGTFVARLVEIEDSLDAFVPGVDFLEARPIGGTAYYTLFIINEDLSWTKDAATSVIVPIDRDSARIMSEMFPTVLVSTDSDILFPPDLSQSDLYKFLYGLGLTYDELSTMIDLILPENRDLQVTRRLHEMLANGVGMPSEYTIGVAASARLKRNSGYIYRNKGTLLGVSAFAESLTGWNTIAIESQNKFLSLDDGSFEYSIGNWSFDASDMTLERVDIDPLVEAGPTMPFESEAYPFSKVGMGKATLVATNARMSLPATRNRELCIPVTGGAAHYLSVPVKASVGSPMIVPSVDWLDQTGTYLSSSFVGNVESSDEWQFSEGTIVAPQGARFAQVHIDISGQEGDELLLDCMSITEGVILRRTNLITNADMSEGGDGYDLVDSSNRALSASEDRVKVGGQSLKVVNTSGTAQTLAVKTTQLVSAIPGETYTGSVFVNPTIDTAIRLSFDWRDESGSVVVSNSTYQTTLDNRWTRVHYTVTAPELVTNLQLRVETEDVFSSSDALYLDGFLIEQSPNLGEFFTGTTANTYGAVSNLYGTFVYSNPEFGFVYRDPRSVTIICQPDRVNLLFDPTFSLPNQSEIGEPGTAYGDDEYADFTYGEPGDLATPWKEVNGSFETTTEKFLTGSRSGKASGEAWDVYSLRVPVVGTYPYAIAATVSGEEDATCAMYVYWFDYSDTFLGESVLNFEQIGEDWARGDVAVTAPTTASYAIVAFRGSGTVFIDNAMMERADRPLTFFSGDISNSDATDARWSNPGPRSYALLYDNAPVKIGRLRQTLPYYLPHGMVGRVLLWDSLDPEVQSLIPRGLYDEG